MNRNHEATMPKRSADTEEPEAESTPATVEESGIVISPATAGVVAASPGEAQPPAPVEVHIPDPPDYRPPPPGPVHALVDAPEGAPIARREIKAGKPIQYARSRFAHRAAIRQWKLSKLMLGR